ncbi:hypothetical protein CERZMDRAFT_102677 [Cercospora zeae-maydis SCOH1-5]|uniref:Very long-chain fatty acid transport protein n=1 Tax=Cercospora zeae-maydis SCOH1-5 TaxID=717836 RepID=A0A6A6F0A9_9PEZI|nr:hypothetical protein CERZMDRAFT_102677 [Cercospora zeae-maydis SCOH1-5]
MALVAASAAAAAGAAYLDAKYLLSRDARALWKGKKAQRVYEQAVKDDKLSQWYTLAATCARQPNDRAIWTRERSWTFRELHDQAARYAQWMLDQGVKPGDLVAMYLHNSAEFLMIMFATLCIGAGPALINYNLEGAALMHCLSVCESKLLIIDADAGCQQRIAASQQDIEAAGTKIVTLDHDLKSHIGSRQPTVPPDSLRSGMKGDQPYCLLYTSGTTGLPKGCPFTISRVHLQGTHLEPPFGLVPGKDCWYNPMPLYHGTGLITVSTSLLAGVGCAIAPRFSVKNFWPDIHDSEATTFIYVGETARYLLAAPAHPLETSHKLRLAYGNGLRPDVWSRLQSRFNIPEVGEFFNSSEGMLGLVVWSRNKHYNNCVGHHGLITRALYHNVYIPVRVDPDTGDIYRDPKTGFAQRAPYEEGGEILVAVPNKEAFGGYWRNPEATNKRFATDVFKKGDLYYRSGDALRRDSDGFWYFLDRLGDTFRWKSENVSTAEVAEVLGRYPGIEEANVYGVSVPGYEGRAGCAALQLANRSDALSESWRREVLEHCRKALPRYAVPVFLRVQQKSTHIHNHKQNKVGLRQEGVDPDLLGKYEKEGTEDMFLWVKPGGDTYVQYRRSDWDDIKAERARL